MENRWRNDITEVGYKYQMTDVSASMGLEAMKQLPQTLGRYRELFDTYRDGLAGIPGITFIGDDQDHRSSCWLATVMIDDRDGLKWKLAENDIESNQVHYRNDIYSIFGGRIDTCPNMDAVESKYLVLPQHLGMTVEDVNRVLKVIKSGW